jgi:galactokinase
MRLDLTIPARINILGSSTDACEVDYCTIGAAVDIHAGATAIASGNVSVGYGGPAAGGAAREHGTDLAVGALVEGRAECAHEYKILAEPIAALCEYSEELRSKIRSGGFSITVWTQVPRQSGLGGSSLLILLVLGALRELYDLDRQRHNDYVIAEITQRTEEHRVGVFCGFADRYIPLFGDIAYLDYRGKLHHKPLKQEPYVTYEKLGRYVDPPRFVVVSSGVSHDSGDVHGRMRRMYLDELAAEGEEGYLYDRFRTAGDTAWRGKIALLEGDRRAFGEQIALNHRIVDEIMRHCGFDDGAGAANNTLFEAALSAGALGARSTGAGGGGSVFALAEQGTEDDLLSTMLASARSAGFENAEGCVCSVSEKGLVIRKS